MSFLDFAYFVINREVLLMDKMRRFALYALVLLTFSVTFVACDSGGSNNGDPEWVGSWEILNYGGGQGAPSDPTYWNITQENLEEVEDDEEGCIINSLEITESDGGVVTLINSENEVNEVRFEVSGNTMTATVLDTPDDEDVGNEITLESVDGAPRDIADCDQ